MGVITRRNLNTQLPNGDTSSIAEIAEMLTSNGVIPTAEEGKSKEFAEVITKMNDRVSRGELITPVEFSNRSYTTAMEWFDGILPDMER
jgi:hypothetical protein